MQPRTQWTEQRIREFLSKEDLRYHRISLPFGLETPGHDRSKTCDKVFSGGLDGKSVLDVGSWLGYFCLEALARGANRAVGWEFDPDRVRQARTIAEIVDSPVEYFVQDLNTASLDEAFDVVLCLNVLHHLLNPVEALDRLIRLTRKRLVLEVPTIGKHDRVKLGISSLGAFMLHRVPAIFVGQGGTTPPYDRQQKFYFTKSAVTNLLNYHRQYFSNVQIIDSDFRNRFIVIADRRRIKNLLVIAGPPLSGKTALMRELVADPDHYLLHACDLQGLKGPVAMQASELRTLKDRQYATVFFEYDMLRPYFRSTRTYALDEVLHIMSGADKINVVTIWSESRNLLSRLDAGRLVYKPNQVRDIYEHTEKLQAIYRDWIEFCAKHSLDKHFVYEATSFDEGKLTSTDDWQNRVL